MIGYPKVIKIDTYASKNFKVLAYRFRFLIHFEFIFCI